MKPESYMARRRLGSQLLSLLSGDQTQSENETMVERTYDGTEDHFLQEASGVVRGHFTGAKQPLEQKKIRAKVNPKQKNAKQRSGKQHTVENTNANFSKALANDFYNRWKIQDTAPYSVNPYSDIYRDFLKAQVTVRNLSPAPQEVTLWGSDGSFSTFTPLPEEVQYHTISSQLPLATGVHPQGISYNPANQCIYVANQLSGTITVFNSANQPIAEIALEPSFPGMISPVAIAVNTKAGSSTYGFTYVACSVANAVAVIDLTLNVTAMIPVGTRPLDIAFNPVNKRLYVANLADDTVSIINAESFAPVAGSPISVGNDPLGIAISPDTGDVYIANSLSNNLTVISAANVVVATIPLPGLYPTSVAYNPADQTMYAICTNSDNVHQIDIAYYRVMATLPTGSKPYHAFFNDNNSYLYIQNRQDNTFTIIRPYDTPINGLSFGEQNIGGVYNPANQFIYISDTANNTINVIGYLSTTSFIVTDPGYPEMNEAFKLNPAILQHVKFVVTGPDRIYSFRRNRFTAFGSTKSKALSFELYASPQSAMNVAEVYELAGTIIDRKMNWRFMLPGLHTVSILFWYRQFELQEFLQPPTLTHKN